MTYPKLLIASVVAGLLAGLVIFLVLFVFRDSFEAAQELNISRAKGGVSILVLLPGFVLGWLFYVAAPRVTDYAGSALALPLLLAAAVAIALSVGLIRSQLADVRAPITELAVMSCLVMLGSAGVFGWINR